MSSIESAIMVNLFEIAVAVAPDHCSVRLDHGPHQPRMTGSINDCRWDDTPPYRRSPHGRRLIVVWAIRDGAVSIWGGEACRLKSYESITKEALPIADPGMLQKFGAGMATLMGELYQEHRPKPLNGDV
jgi:hypothetical protein